MHVLFIYLFILFNQESPIEIKNLFSNWVLAIVYIVYFPIVYLAYSAYTLIHNAPKVPIHRFVQNLTLQKLAKFSLWRR